LLPGHLLSRHLLPVDICSPTTFALATLAPQRHLLSNDTCSPMTFALQYELSIDKIINLYIK
jgi:hypothetical protein